MNDQAPENEKLNKNCQPTLNGIRMSTVTLLCWLDGPYMAGNWDSPLYHPYKYLHTKQICVLLMFGGKAVDE